MQNLTNKKLSALKVHQGNYINETVDESAEVVKLRKDIKAKGVIIPDPTSTSFAQREPCILLRCNEANYIAL